MNKQEKNQVIQELREKFDNNSFIYFTDASSMTVAQVNRLRRMCFQQGVQMSVVKNSLARKAMEGLAEERGFAQVYDSLVGPTAIMLSETANLPARLIKEFRKDGEKPVLKVAYIDADIFLGDNAIEVLVALKSKNELIGDVLALLQSPAKNVISALKSGGNTIAGLLKTLEERAS